MGERPCVFVRQARRSLFVGAPITCDLFNCQRVCHSHGGMPIQCSVVLAVAWQAEVDNGGFLPPIGSQSPTSSRRRGQFVAEDSSKMNVTVCAAIQERSTHALYEGGSPLADESRRNS